MEQELIKTLINAGVGGAIAALIIVLIYRITVRISVKVGLRIADSLQAQAEALTKQSTSMEILAKSIQDFFSKDNSEHREIIIMLKVISEGLERRKDGS